MEKGKLYKKRSKELRNRFGDVAEEYEEYRFEYPKELYECIKSYTNTGERALEIGIGTGKATRPFLDMGYTVVAIEPVEKMLEIAKEKYKNDNIEFIDTTFEEAEINEQFDIIYAASSFQWINDGDRFCKVIDLLKQGGTFARFKTVNLIDENKGDNNRELIKTYMEYIPDYLPCDKRKQHVSDEEYEQVGFYDFVRKDFIMDHELESEKYIKLINTYTEYITLPEKLRIDFEDVLRKKLTGEKIVLTQKCTLHLARK